MGVSSTCEGVTLEQCAHNMGYRRPDVRECCPMKGKCRRDIEDSCITSSHFDMHSLSSRVNTTAPPPPILVLVSRNAGRCVVSYFCLFFCIRLHCCSFGWWELNGKTLV